MHELLLYWPFQSLWLCESQQAVKNSSEMGMPNHLTCLLRNLYAFVVANIVEMKVECPGSLSEGKPVFVTGTPRDCWVLLNTPLTIALYLWTSRDVNWTYLAKLNKVREWNLTEMNFEISTYIWERMEVSIVVFRKSYFFFSYHNMVLKPFHSNFLIWSYFPRNLFIKRVSLR